MGALVIFVAFLIVLAIVVFLVYLVWRFIKFKDDAFYQVKRKRKKMCKLHADKFRSPQKFWKFWRVTDNQPVVCQYQEDGKIKTKTVGYYKGHYQTNDCTMIAFVDKIHKWLFVFPEVNILILNKKEEVMVRVRDEDTQKIKEIKIKYPKIVETFTDDMIIINARGVDDVGYFFIPIIKDNKGNVVDLKLPAYHSARDVILNQYLYQQTMDYISVNKKMIDFNPLVKFSQETSDSTKSLETTPPS